MNAPNAPAVVQMGSATCVRMTPAIDEMGTESVTVVGTAENVGIEIVPDIADENTGSVGLTDDTNIGSAESVATFAWQ